MTLKKYRNFNILLLVFIVLNIMAIASINIVVDPYGILKSLGIIGTNKSKLESPKSTQVTENQQKKPTQPQKNSQQVAKARYERLKFSFSKLSLTSINPKTIILGSSTALKLSPKHPALTLQPAYNLALPGAKMYDVKSYFDETIANQPDLKQVVISLDFFSFGGEKGKVKPKPVTQIRKNKYSISIPELINMIFSVDTFNSSLQKLMVTYIQPEPLTINKPPKVPPEGIKSRAKRIPLKLANQGSTKNLNKIKKDFITEYKSKKASDFRRVILLYFNEKTLYKNYYLSPEELKNFKAIIDICKQRNITVKVFFSPIHAAQLEAIQTTGLWQSFEEWKRQVIAITPAWDFSDYNSVTTEPINDQMENYVDSVHYKEEIADLILDRLYNYDQKAVPSKFGFLITPANIESHLSKIRAERQAWLKTNPSTLKFVQEIKKQTNLK